MLGRLMHQLLPASVSSSRAASTCPGSHTPLLGAAAQSRWDPSSEDTAAAALHQHCLVWQKGAVPGVHWCLRWQRGPPDVE